MAVGFDLISSEYGWSDKKILNLPLPRFNQILAAIRTRMWLHKREQDSRFSWQTRVLAQYIAGGWMVEGENTAVGEAAKIAFDDIEAAMLGITKEPTSSEPKAGSFERLMGFIGQKKD